MLVYRYRYMSTYIIHVQAKVGMQIKSNALLICLLSLLIWSCTCSSYSISVSMAENSVPKTSSSTSEAAVHIVYTEKPETEDPEAYHIRTLASVLGSEDAAKEGLIYSYKHAASGFSAKLTPEQVSEMSRQPGVLQVVPSRTLQLHSGPGNKPNV